jgi:hypothetical protein
MFIIECRIGKGEKDGTPEAVLSVAESAVKLYLSSVSASSRYSMRFSRKQSCMLSTTFVRKIFSEIESQS